MVSSSSKVGTAVAGGGLVGLAIAYGLVRRGEPVTVFDEAGR